MFDEEQNRLANAKKEQKEKADEKTHLQETHQSVSDTTCDDVYQRVFLVARLAEGDEDQVR